MMSTRSQTFTTVVELPQASAYSLTVPSISVTHKLYGMRQLVPSLKVAAIQLSPYGLTGTWMNNSWRIQTFSGNRAKLRFPDNLGLLIPANVGTVATPAATGDINADTGRTMGAWEVLG